MMFNMFQQLESLKQFLNDEHGRKILTHPKLQALLTDPDFQQAVSDKNYLKLLSHAGFTALASDPEFQEIMQQFKGHSDLS